MHASGYEPDWLVAIARGGLVIGGALAYALGHKNIATVNVEFYTGIDERLDVPVELPRSIVRSDSVWRRTDRWIDFPWSAEPPIGSARPRP